MPSGIQFAKPFVQATIHVLTTMASITPTPGTPYVKSSSRAQGDVSAIVGITGDQTGSIALTFSKQCAIAIVRNMLGEHIEDIINDTKDAVGEITNMISGQARAGLVSLGVTFQGSTPSIIMGNGHTICHYADAAVVAIPFKTEHGEFTLEFAFADN